MALMTPLAGYFVNMRNLGAGPKDRQGRSNAKTLFDVDQLPSDNHIRSMLDGVPLEHFDAMFYHVIDHLKQQDALDPLRRRGACMLIALDGTE